MSLKLREGIFSKKFRKSIVKDSLILQQLDCSIANGEKAIN